MDLQRQITVVMGMMKKILVVCDNFITLFQMERGDKHVYKYILFLQSSVDLPIIFQMCVKYIHMHVTIVGFRPLKAQSLDEST